MNAPTPPFHTEIYAAFEWWDAAGVDIAFADEPSSWLREEPGIEESTGDIEAAQSERSFDAGDLSARPDAAAIERLDLLGSDPPDTLEAFHRFWLEAPELDPIGSGNRVPPRGPEGAPLMVLVVDPEPGDSERLLSGAGGRLLGNILRAMEIDFDAIYLASALLRHTPEPDTAAIAARGMDSVLAHHIALARPKAVLALGQALAPLLGEVKDRSARVSPEINHDGAPVPVLLCEDLASMMAMPRLKQRFWRRWIEWSAAN